MSGALAGKPEPSMVQPHGNPRESRSNESETQEATIVNHYKSLAPSQPLPCPIDGLPIELLATILVIAAKSSEHLKSRLNFPVQIQLVCNLWRAVALSTPALWAILDLQRSENFYNNYLNNSGTVPLEVYVRSGPPSMRLVDLLRQVSPRINIIWLLVGGGGVQDALSILRDPLPNVVEFNLLRDMDGTQRTGNVFPFQDFPSLRSLHLQNFDLRFSDLAVSGLEELRIAEYRSRPVAKGQLLTVLLASPGLQVLELGNMKFETSSPATSSTTIQCVPLDHLRHLVLRNFFRLELEDLFSWISATHLRRLEIWGAGPGRPLHEAAERWRFRKEYDRSPDLDIGSRFPVLETLKMDESPETAAFTMAFRSTLKHLVLIVDKDDHLMCRMFEDLLWRWDKGEATPLESLTTKGVSMYFIQDIRPRVVPKLRRVVIESSDVFLRRGAPDGYVHARAECKRNIEGRLGVDVEVDWEDMQAHRNPRAFWSDTWVRH